MTRKRKRLKKMVQYVSKKGISYESLGTKDTMVRGAVVRGNQLEITNPQGRFIIEKESNEEPVTVNMEYDIKKEWQVQTKD